MTYTQNTDPGVGATLKDDNFRDPSPMINSYPIVIDRIKSGKLGVNQGRWMDDGCAENL
jgi:hypothetical protein